ncbi:hypothetical protein MTO96_016367 [Rhipicephalus appendiculatus]
MVSEVATVRSLYKPVAALGGVPGLQQPASFNFNDPSAWSTWIEQFEDYAYATGMHRATDEVRASDASFLFVLNTTYWRRDFNPCKSKPPGDFCSIIKMSIPELQPPPPFLRSPGQPAVPWDQWKQAFQTHMVASGASDLPAERRKAILLTCLSMEGQRIFSTLKPVGLHSGSATVTTANPSSTGDNGSTDDAYDTAIALLSDHFKHSVNVIVARQRCSHRAQHAGTKKRTGNANKTAEGRLCHAATVLPLLEPGYTVWVRDIKEMACVLSPASKPRSYVVETPTAVLLRNRVHLVPYLSQLNQPASGENGEGQEEQATVTREQRRHKSPMKAELESPRFGRRVKTPSRLVL